MRTLNALSLNNTHRAENQIVIFNRVPKVGSQLFMEVSKYEQQIKMENDTTMVRRGTY